MIVPTFTFCSTANFVVYLGAHPVLVDVGEDFNVTPEAIEAAITPRIRAIMPVHFSGQACDLEAIYTIAAQHNLSIVEDAAQVARAVHHGQKIGSDDLTRALPGGVGQEVRAVTVFSFQAIKNMTTAEGGMITTADDELATHISHGAALTGTLVSNLCGQKKV